MLLDMIRNNIGIYYKDSYWKDKIFEKIMQEAKELYLLKTVKEERISLIGGIEIYFCKIDTPDRCRGRRYDRVYYQNNIEPEIVRTIIMPLVINKMSPLYLV